LAIESTVQARVAEPRITVLRPGLVARALDELAIRIDGRNPGVHRVLNRDGMDAFVGWLANPARRLPVVVTTEGPGHSSEGLGHEVLRYLGGVVHVVHLAPAATYALTDAVGQFRSTFAGAVRLFWPGFGRTSDGYAHPLWLPGQLDYLGDERFLRELSTRVGRVAAMTIGAPDLERTLRAEMREAQVEERRQERSRLESRLRDATASTQDRVSVIDLESWEQFCRDFDRLEIRVAELEDDKDTLELELEEERGRREAAEQLAKLAWTTVRAEHGDDQPVAQDTSPPETVLDAVKQAESRCPHLVFLPESFDSARESLFPRPSQRLTTCCSSKT
jgi:hypothetical protein